MQSPNSAINNTTEVTLPRDPDEQPPKRAAVRRELKLKFHHFLTQSSPTAQKAAHQRLFFTVPPAAVRKCCHVLITRTHLPKFLFFSLPAETYDDFDTRILEVGMLN